jgi:hypothetical protein
LSWGFAFRLRQHLKGSLWVVPFLGAALGPVLGLLVNWLDDTVQLPEAWRYSASTASGLLTVLVGAMVALHAHVLAVAAAAHRGQQNPQPRGDGRVWSGSRAGTTACSCSTTRSAISCRRAEGVHDHVG